MTALTVQEKEGLARILKIASPDDVKVLEILFSRSGPFMKPQADPIKAILENVKKPSEILRHENIRRETLVTYLKENRLRVQKEQSKDACVRMCVEKWHVKDDNFWAKRPRQEGRVLHNIPPLENYMNRKTDVSRENCTKTNKLGKIARSPQERHILPQLKKQKEAKDLSLRKVPTESQTKELPSPSGKNLSMSTVPTARSIKERKLELTPFTASSDAKSDPERPQSTTPLLPYSSAPMHHNNNEQSTFLSSAPNFFSSEDNLSSRMMPRKPSPNGPLSFSLQSPDVDNPSPVSDVDYFPPVPDTSASYVSSRCTYEVENGSPELPSTQPFSLSTEQDNPSTVDIVKDEHNPGSVSPSSSSASSRLLSKEKMYPSKDIHTSTSMPVISVVSVLDASVQTLLSEPLKFLHKGSAASQKYQNMMFTEKDNEFIPSLGNLCPTMTLNCKRPLFENPEEEYGSPHHSNSNATKDYTAGISSEKRIRTLSSNEAFSLRNADESESTITECPNCKKQYSSLSLHSNRNESDVSLMPPGFKKKRPPSLSESVSPAKQQRLPTPSKGGKGASFFYHRNQRPWSNKESYKRKCLTPSRDKLTSPLHGSRHQPKFSSKEPCYTSTTFFERRKQLKSLFTKVNRGRVNVSEKPRHKNRTSVFQTLDEEMRPAFSKNCPSPKNSADKTTELPRRSSSAPPALLRRSESTLKSAACSPEISEENKNPSTEISESPDLKEPLRQPRRKWCVLM